MKITINGEQAEITDGIPVSELLTVREVKMPETVTVELNGTILDRQAFAATILQPEDAVEFLYFMGGG